MGDPHRTDRYGELWDQHRIDVCLTVLEFLKPHVVLSGGWAWHVMSPPGHPEYKHAHDHKDIDVFSATSEVPVVMGILRDLGFERVGTRYDRLPSEEEFRRYEMIEDGVRVTIDFFVKDVPERVVDGWRVVDPTTLLTFYGRIHSSDKCFAVVAASKLLAAGIDPVGRPELVEIPKV